MTLPPTSSSRCLTLLVALSFSAHLAMAQLGAAKAEENLLKNGSFDKGTEGWVVSANKKAGTMAIDDAVKHGTNVSLRLENRSGDDTFVRQKVTVKPNTRYRLTGYIKTKDVMEVKRGGKAGATLSLGGGSFEKSEVVAKTSSWNRVTMEFATGNETEVELGPRLGHFSALTIGTAWFADLKLDELGKTSKQR